VRRAVSSHQLVHGDRQVSNTLASHVIHGAGNGRRYKHGGQFTKTLGTKRACIFIAESPKFEPKVPKNVR
jgi:hypothetical protein